MQEESEIKAFVYLILNQKNDSLYVGKARDPVERWRCHQGFAAKGDVKPLYSAIRKHGVSNFELQIIEECANDQIAYEKEREWISKFRLEGRRLYNLNDGGDGSSGHVMPESAKKAISDKLKGRILSEETKKKISLAKMGHAATCFGHSKETREKISIAHRGKRLSDETKEKLRQINLGKKRSKTSDDISPK